MSRFDPMTYPDRFAFEANARRIRNEELGKLADAAVAWLEERRQQWSARMRRFPAAPAMPAHRPSTR
jgi:hypothetical protein